MIVFQVGAFILVREQSWYVEFDFKNPCYLNTTVEERFRQQHLDKNCDPKADHVASYEDYTVFSVSQFQYIILIIAFAKVS